MNKAGANRHFSARGIALTGMLSAMYAVISQFSLQLPSGVPLTFQCFAIVLGAFAVGTRCGVMSTLVYIAVGAAGLPVFSALRGGVDVLIGVTGGFIWGFIAIAAICGIAAAAAPRVKVAAACASVLICHAVGVLQFAFVLDTDIASAFLTASAPYLLKDIILSIAASYMSTPIRLALRKEKGI